MTERQSRPELGAAKMSIAGDTSRVQEPTSYLENFTRRLLQDALSEAAPAYWRRRAKALRAARHRSGDYLPSDHLEAARAKWRTLTELAAACEAKAAFLEMYGNEIFAADVASVLGEGVTAA